MKNEEKIGVREAASRSLLRCFNENKFSNIEVDTKIKKYRFEGSDKALFTTLVYGVIERLITLDYIISRFSSRPPEKLEDSVKTILRLGVFQIVFCDRIPDSAAVSESVELSKKLCHKGVSGFVNGVLRSVARGKDSIDYSYGCNDTAELFQRKYSVKKWICELFISSYGEEKAEEILSASHILPPLSLRVNTLKTDRQALLDTLPKSEALEETESGIRFLSPVPISEINQIESGLCFVQDKSSQLCVKAVDARAGQTVIDTCSCPGGKSFGMAIDMENSGRLLSFDLHESKLSLVKKGAERLGISIIEAKVQDGAKKEDSLTKTADRVLCDVPCSGLGVLAKKPDLRYKRKEDIDRLPDIQYAILESSSAYVKKNGFLIYSTCTLNPAENEEIVKRFLTEHKEFIPETAGMPEGQSSVTLFPSKSGSDGFFIAKFKRI